MRGSDARQMGGYMKRTTEHWYSPEGIISNFRTIRWLPLTGSRSEPGLIRMFVKTTCTIILFALLFLGMDAVLALVLSMTGLL